MLRMHLRTRGTSVHIGESVSQAGLVEVQTGARPTGSSPGSLCLTTQLGQVQRFGHCVKQIHGVLSQDVVGPESGLQSPTVSLSCCICFLHKPSSIDPALLILARAV